MLAAAFVPELEYNGVELAAGDVGILGEADTYRDDLSVR